MKKIFIFFIILSPIVFSQNEDIQIGRGSELFRYYGNYFDYSDPTAINIKVSVWGYVRSSGKYLVPIYTSVYDLLSYAGGPNESADLDELRLYRVNENGNEELIKFNYNDLYRGEQLNTKRGVVPILKGGDILIVPGSPKYYFMDYFSISLSILSVLISVTSLIIYNNR